MAQLFAMSAGGRCAFRGDCAVFSGRQAPVAQRGALQVLTLELARLWVPVSMEAALAPRRWGRPYL